MGTRAIGMAAALLVLLTLLTETAGLADSIQIGGLVYKDISVVGLRAGNVAFVVGGKTILQPLKQVCKIDLAGNGAMAQAEGLLAQRKFPEAIAAYKLALAQAGKAEPEIKNLIRARQAMAEKGEAPAEPPKKDEDRCPLCRGLGKCPCRDCIVSNVPSGKARCTECAGMGRATCPACNGQWETKCEKCGGSGRIVSGTTGGIFKQKTYTNCPYCNGTGQRYRLWLIPDGSRVHARSCPRCGGEKVQKLRGTILCPICKGATVFGPCPTCTGEKTVVCPRCGGSGKASADAAESAGPFLQELQDPIVWTFHSARATAAKAEYDRRVDAADIAYADRVKAAEAERENGLRTIRLALIQELDAALKEATKAGDLDDAIKIRDAKRIMEGTE